MLIFIFFPFLNFLGLLLFGRVLGKVGTLYWTFLNVVFSILFAVCFLSRCIKFKVNYFLSLGTWLDVSLLHISWDFLIDPLAVVMLTMVSIISAIVHLYSFDYMAQDPHFIRFISFLSLFTFFMFILVTAGNFVQLFVGWEGVGICSYLLINFWTTRLQAGKAAIKAVLMNRVGDIAFLFALAILYNVGATLDFSVLPMLVPFWSPAILEKIAFFLLIGVVAKSAQIGLHTWLPAAMEGPTPVSALIHAATMVTAGIFLVIRVSFIFEGAVQIRGLAICFGIITAFLSALTACFLYDMKRIIAYSTCSQLGYMLLAAGLSQYHISLFHLVNHAFFKALLFLTAGAIIHSFSNEQDIRKVGALFQRSPFLFTAILIGNFAIMGLPFLAGFYSKDLILEAALLRLPVLFEAEMGWILFIGISIATCLTAIYSCRLVYYLVYKEKQVQYTSGRTVYLQQPFFIQLALSILMLLSIFSGYLLSDLFVDNFFLSIPGSQLSQWWTGLNFELEYFLFFHKLIPILLNIGVISVFVCGLYSFKTLSGDFVRLFYISLPFNMRDAISLSFKLYFISFYYWIFSTSYYREVAFICSYNFYYNELYNYISSGTFFYFYHSFFKTFDKGVLEIWGPSGLSAVYQNIVIFFSSFYKQPFKVHLFTLYCVIICYFFLVELTIFV